MSLRRWRWVAVALVWGTLIAGAASSHSRSVSYSSWELGESDAVVRFRASLLELSRLGLASDGRADLGRALGYFSENLTLSSGDADCFLSQQPRTLRAPLGWVHFEWRLECGPSSGRTIQSRLFATVAPGHLHFARVVDVEGQTIERVLTGRENRWLLPARGGDDVASESRAVGSSWLDYGRLGVEHILTGWDHLAFVLVLLFVAGSLPELLKVVTGFTLAHSVTLALAVIGVLNPNRAAVEALIAFSIVLVAAENTWLTSGQRLRVPTSILCALLGMAVLSTLGFGAVSPVILVGIALFTGCHFLLLGRADRPGRLKIVVAFAFGLIHGFGFAGVLAEMDLPRVRLAPALLGFNAGVELGQLAVVALLWPGLRWLERREPASLYRWVVQFGSAAVCGLGLFWFVSRVYG